MIIKSKAGTEIAKNGYTVIDELNQIPMIKTNYLQLEHNHINPIIIGSKAFEHKDIFVNVVEDTETSGDTAFKEYNAIHEFAWILSGMRKHDSYTGYLSLEQYLTMVLEGTDFTYQVEGGHQYYALQFDNLGDGESHLDMFFKMLNRWNTEFELRGKKVYITHQRGRLRDKHVGRYKMNIIDTIINSDITDGATAVWGYFGKKDEENPENSTYREFYWQIDELVEQYGIRYAKPYSNENITQEETMIEYLNNIILDSWKISTKVDIAEITDEVAQTGDEYVAVDERLGITLNTRIQKLESVYDADDKLLYQTATLGTVSFASAASGSSNQLQEVIEKVKKDYNDRITDLKQEFDNRFNDEVTQIEIDFNELVNGVRQEIQADYDAMSNDFEQMKLNQQQRVDEIYEDIGGINQTVSDVANKADYLDGVYTDLSTQTGEVSSTVANIIDGKAPAGSVLRQTTDSVLSRVWEQDIDSLNFENRNLIRNSNLPKTSTSYLVARYDLTTDWEDNVTYTLTIKGSTNSVFRVWRDNGLAIGHIGTLNDLGSGLYSLTFTTKNYTGSTRNLISVYNGVNDGSTKSAQIEWIKLEPGSKATSYSVAPEDLMKYTDIIARPDGFLIGTFEMGGDKIAQAIVGKSGAIDLIADNVNFTGNVNVANQIKSLSLETVYANISELRTRMLVADVITADMVKFDTALIEKFTSNTAFINSLTAKSAFINNVKAIDIDFNRATARGQNGTDYIEILSSKLELGGRYSWNWRGGTKEYNSNTVFESGYMRMTDKDINQHLYYTQKGISTFNDGNVNESSGTLEFFSYEYDSVRKGVTLSSVGGVAALRSALERAIIDAHDNVYLMSTKQRVKIQPRKELSGNNTFEFHIIDNEGVGLQDGIIYYGSENNPYSSVGLRFSKELDKNTLYVTNGSGRRGTGDLEVRKLRVNENIIGTVNLDHLKTGDIIFGSLKTANTSTNTYIGVGSAELRITNNEMYNGGNTVYRDIQFGSARLNGNIADYGAGSWFYVGTNRTLGVRFTDNNWNNGNNPNYKDIQFKSWHAHSSELAKHDIEDWNFNVLDRFRNELKLSRFRFNNDEKKILQPGIIVHVDPRKDTFPIEWRRGDSFNGNIVMWWTVKGVQELAHENDTLKDRINDLENKLNKIMEMIA